LLAGDHPDVVEDVDRGGEGFAAYGQADHVGAGSEEWALWGTAAESAAATTAAAGCYEGDLGG
jgi:hypothetical protein